MTQPAQHIKADKSALARDWTNLAFDTFRAEPVRKKEIVEGPTMLFIS
jgi:hypothetical protein